MLSIDTHDPNRLIYTQGGWMSFVGLLCFAPAWLLMYGWLSGCVTFTDKNRVGFTFTIIAYNVFGAAFLVWGRRGLIFDMNARTIKRWYGLFFPLWSRIHDLEAFRNVLVREGKVKVWWYDNHNFVMDYLFNPYYRVYLIGPLTDELLVSKLRDEAEARRLAEEIGKFLNLGLVSERKCSQDAAPGPIQVPVARTARRHSGQRKQAVKTEEQATGSSLVDIREAMQLLGITENELQNLVARGDLRAYCVTGEVKFRRDDVLALNA
ncbi:MAG: helix-turn-helix domain-containing protein [Planctomycetota bacterium]